MGLCSYPPDIELFIPNRLTARITCPFRLGFTIDCSFSTSSSRLNIPISMPLTPDPLSPDFPSSVYPTRTKLRHSMAAFYSSQARFPMPAREMKHSFTPSSPRIYKDESLRQGEKEKHTRAYFRFVSLHFSSLRLFSGLQTVQKIQYNTSYSNYETNGWILSLYLAHLFGDLKGQEG